MSLKDLFESTKVTKSGSADETAYEVESEAYTDAYITDKNEYVPPVDFSTASNFARYGSAAKYYEDSIKRIYENYPYDGSKFEVLDYHNSSSYLDRWMLEYKYPRTTGYISLGTTSGSGDWLAMVSESSGVGGWGMPDTTSNNILEYIDIKGGPHTGSADRTFATSSHSLKEVFQHANVYDSGSARESNLEYDLRTGVTVEFWMLKNAFYTSKTEREVVFDLWNNENSSSAGYGRLMIELTGGADGGSSIRLTAQSGTTGFVNEPIATVTPSQVADGVWKHYAVTLKNAAADDGIVAKLYVNGQLSGSSKLGSSVLGRVTGSLNATIGALVAPPSGATGYYDSTTITKGGAKLSASLDEFRYWKLERDARQVGRNWFTQVGGGTNTDEANVGLGVYYKFNEGIMNSGSRDSVVLDYSGRISNGFWKGATAEVRNSGSAMASGSHNKNEFHDPVIYSEHILVEQLEEEMIASGTFHDNQNNSLITSNFPDWIDTESRETTLKHFTQIMASYFDKLHMQIEGLQNIKEKYATSYATGDVSASFKPLPFAKKLVSQYGIATPELLQDAELIEQFLDRSEKQEYGEKLHNIRNQIYSNVYANMLYIFKSKGTEKSMRNMLRCFGIDDELVKINVYSDGSDYVFKDNRRSTSNKTNYVSFAATDRMEGTVYQAVSMSVDGVYSNPNIRSYITGSSNFGDYNPQTIECEVFFPLKVDKTDSTHWYQDAYITASLFGAMGTVESQTDTRFPTDDPVDLRVFVVKDKLESTRAKFQVSSSVLGILTSDFYEDVYDDTRWNFAVRVKPTKDPWIDHISGSTGALGAQTFDVEFYGVNVFTDVIQNEFLKTLTVSEAVGKSFLSSSKRCYVGALHENFTGSILHKSNVEIGNLRYWMSNISDEVVLTHAMDQSSFGVESPYKNVFLYQTDMSGTYVPQIETLALHWNFDNVTGSGESPSVTEGSKDAQFIVQDVSSGSAEHGDRYEARYSDQVKIQHVGIGDFFLENKTNVVNTRYIPTAKLVLPEYLHSSDMVEIRQRDDEFFTRESRPAKVIYSIEKSMYQTISEEMIKMFATIKDFDNLIGEPVNRYRHEYKDLAKLRQLFFERMPNTPDLDKYIDYYKWIDDAVSKFIEDLMPASTAHSKGMQNMVESHMLERNKYQTRYPSMEFEGDPPIGSAEGINKLLYDYQRGHAPVPLAPGGAEMMDQDQNCLWWSKRAEREHPILANEALSSSSPAMNLSGTTTSRIGIFSASSQTFNRAFTTPYRYSAMQSRLIHGGINFDNNKSLGYVYPATVPFSPTPIEYGNYGGYPLGYLLAKDMDKDASPEESLPNCDLPRSSSYGDKVKREGYKVIDGWQSYISAHGGNPSASHLHWASSSYTTFRGNLVMPFNVVSSSQHDINAGYTTLIDQNLTVFKGTGVGHSTGSGTYVNKQRDPTQGLHNMHGDEVPTQLGGLGRGVNLVNLHTDTYGDDKETPMQGPFTEKYVGGRAYRHADINDGTDTLRNRQEGFLVLISTALSTSHGVLHANSGGVGLVGPDYPFPHGPYPFAVDNAVNWRPIGGRYYRDETAKRPVNIRNIQMKTSSIAQEITDPSSANLDATHPRDLTGYEIIGEHRHDTIANTGDAEGDWTKVYHEQIATGSARTIIGNYRHNYEVVHTVGRSSQKPFLRDNQSVRNILQTGSFAAAPSIKSTGADNAPRSYGDRLAQTISEDLLGNGDLPASTHIETILTQKFQSTGSKDFKDTAAAEDEHIVPTLTHLTGAVLAGARVIVSDVSGGVGGANLFNGNATTTGSLDTYKFLPTPDMHLNMDHRIQDRSSGSTNLNTIIANRFSAPGGPRNQSKGFLDLAAEEYSVYNAYTFRNLEVLGSSSGEAHSIRANIHDSTDHPRLGLQSLRRMPSGRFGAQVFYSSSATPAGQVKGTNGHYTGSRDHPIASDTNIQERSEDYTITPSWHKIHRNPKLELRDVVANAKATVTIEFPDEHLAINQTIKIIHYFTSDGGAQTLERTFTAKDMEGVSAASREFSYNGTAAQKATSLATALAHNNGFGVGFNLNTDEVASGKLILTQGRVGEGGATVIVSNLSASVEADGTNVKIGGREYNVPTQALGISASAATQNFHWGGWSSHDTTEKLVFDNDFVTRPIPRNDYQYSWISASLQPSSSGHSLHNLGYGYHMDGLNHPTPSGSRPVDPIIFISASEGGSALGTSNTHASLAHRNHRYYGVASTAGGAQFVPNVHRLNLNLREAQNTWLTDGSGAIALGFYATGGILPADEPQPIDSGYSHTDGAAYASKIANLHNYVNTPLQNRSIIGRKFLTSLGTAVDGEGGMTLELHASHSHMVYLQGNWAHAYSSQPDDIGGYAGDNNNDDKKSFRMEPIRNDITPQYWSGSSNGPDGGDYFLNQSIASIFNGLMWKRNGPFGYPTWKQIRGGEHVLAQTMRNNNRYVLVDPQSDRIENPRPGRVGRARSLRRMTGKDAVAEFKRLGHINTAERTHHHYYVPVMDRSSHPLLAAIHKGDFVRIALASGDVYTVTDENMLYASVTHINNIKNFPISKLNEDVGLRDFKQDRTAYNDLYEMYVEMVDVDGENAYTLADLTYRETIFPQSKNVGRHDMRQRSNFDVGFWASDADAEYKDKTDETDRKGYYDPAGRRTFFDVDQALHRRGVWQFNRGAGASKLSMEVDAVNSGAPSSIALYSAFQSPVVDADTGQPKLMSIGKHNHHLADGNRYQLLVSASIWPMDGGRNIDSIAGRFTHLNDPANWRASSSNTAVNYGEEFAPRAATYIFTHGAPGILQNQYTWFHNGQAIGYEPTTIGDVTRNAVVSSSTCTNAVYATVVAATQTDRKNLFGQSISERYVEVPAAGMAFGPSYSRPHMLVGRDSYCSPSAGKAAYSRRFLFASSTNELTGASHFGKGDGVNPFFHAITDTYATIPFTASLDPKYMNIGHRAVSQLTRSIGHEVEGLYVSDWEWKAPLQSGKAPFYANYSKWFEELRGKSQDRQVIPEYRISDRIPYFVLDKQGRFTSKDTEWLSIHGNPSSSVGPLTGSKHSRGIGTNVSASFMSDYAVTAAPALFDAINADNSGITEPYELTLTCDAILKFLPYQGFYPQLRTVDLCKQFIDSYDDHISFESDLGVNDLPSSFVRSDSSGSLKNPGATDWFGFSPFAMDASAGATGGVLAQGSAEAIMEWYIHFDNRNDGTSGSPSHEWANGDIVEIQSPAHAATGNVVKIIQLKFVTAGSGGNPEAGEFEITTSSPGTAIDGSTDLTALVEIGLPANESQVGKVTAQIFQKALHKLCKLNLIDYGPAGIVQANSNEYRLILLYTHGTAGDLGTGTAGAIGKTGQIQTSGIDRDGAYQVWGVSGGGQSARKDISDADDLGFGILTQGADGASTDISAATFYSVDQYSAFDFSLDEIHDPTNQRVGGSGELSEAGFETHGRNAPAAKRPFYGPFMAPGILFNTIKSGVAVDYPVLNRKLATTASVDRDGGRNYQIMNEYFDQRLPFETLIEPEKYLTDVPLVDMEPHPSASINVTASWDGQGDPLYKMMMHNFLAEIPNFFLANQSMQSFVSLPESHGSFGQVEAVVHNGEQVIPEYRMMVKLYKSQRRTRRIMPPSASNHWQNHRGALMELKQKTHAATISGTLVYNGMYEPCYYTDVIGMGNFGVGSEGGTGIGHYIDHYQSPFGVDYSKQEAGYPRPQREAPETITMYSRPSAFGPPCAGGYAFEPELEYIFTGSAAPMSMSYDPDGKSTGNVSAPHKPVSTEGDFIEGHVAGSGSVGKVADRTSTTWGMKDGTTGYNAPFTPPYYDGQAWAFITFKPSRTGKHYLDEIWENSTINYLRYEFDYISGAYGDWGTIGPQGYAINVNAMQIDATVNLMGRTAIKEVTYDAITGLPSTVGDSNQTSARNSAWVIQPKLETPILHFGYGLTDNQTAPTLSGSTSASCRQESNGYHHGYPGLCEPIGMWHQYGEIPSASQGIYLEVADIPVSYLRHGTEMTIANPKWLHITGNVDPNCGATANVVSYKGTDVQGTETVFDGAPDWDGHISGSDFAMSLITGSSAGLILRGQGYRFSGSFSGSEDAYIVGRATIEEPDRVADGTLERGGRQQYMRWRLMSTGSLAGIIADPTHLQIISADDGKILDTTWGCPLMMAAPATPGLSGSGPAFERGFYIDANTTGSNIISGSLHAGGTGGTTHDDQRTYLNRGYPGTSSARQLLMGIGKLTSSFCDEIGPIRYRNYYTQWKHPIPNNPSVDQANLAVSYGSELHKNKRGAIPNPPHFSNNISTGSFGDALGATLYTTDLMNTKPNTMSNVGYTVVAFTATGSDSGGAAADAASRNNHLNSITHKGPIVGAAIAANCFDNRMPVSNSIGVGRAEIICGYTGSTGRYGIDSMGAHALFESDGTTAIPIAPQYSEWVKVIDGPLSGTSPRFPNTNHMASGYTHGETSYQRYASDYYAAGAGSGSNADIGLYAGVNGFHARTGGSGDTAQGWYGGGLEDIYPLGMTGYGLDDAVNTGNSNADLRAEMRRIDPIKMWYTNPVHIANVRMQDMMHRPKLLTAKGHKLGIKSHPDLEAAVCSPRTVPSGKYLPRNGIPALTRSLGSLVGFDSSAKKLGQLAETKTVKEAVIVMPYVMIRNRRYFVQLDSAQIDRYFGRGDFENTTYWAGLESALDLEGTATSPVSGLQVNLGSSVIRQIRLMGEYVIPPHLDFTRTATATPYAMYIFEYEHSFTAQDLSDMWQGLYPDSGKVMKQVSKQVSHKLNILELLGAAADGAGDNIPEKLRFMVFKVKQRAEINYYAKTADSLDDDRFKFKFRAMEGKRSPDYSYNWPYDFFSLVETAKINMSVTLRNKRLIQDVQLQELNERITLEPVVSTITSMFGSRLGASGVTTMSMSEESVRAGARMSSAASLTASTTATYGSVSMSSTSARTTVSSTTSTSMTPSSRRF